ncbi:MAG TPA: hypothetical protein VF621_03265, partial [Pyrinomonadaceae bacterium]
MSMPTLFGAQMPRAEVKPSSLATRLLLRLLFEAGALTLLLVGLPVLFVFLAGLPFALIGAVFALILLSYRAFFKAVRRVRRLGKRYSAMRYTTVDARQRLLRDSRPPVLYLRSFLEELPDDPLRSDLRTDEELLDDVLREVGPFVAVGRPDEPLPPLGASRLYIPDADWQREVEDLMKRARLVVIKPGLAHNLAWEIEQASALASPEKILFPLLDDSVRKERFYREFRKIVREKMGVDLPGEVGRAIFLCFGEDKTPYFVTPKGSERRKIQDLSSYDVRRALDPE